MSPIFKNMEQAIHFAFVMAAYPAAPRDTLQDLGRVASRTGARSEIDFGSLTPAEIRSECEGIRQSVLKLLPAAEACALLAKYTADLTQRKEAAALVEHHFWPAIRKAFDSRPLFHAVVQRYYAQFDQHDAQHTFRAIAARCEVSKERVQRITKLFEELASAIEGKAMANMSAQYEQKGIIQQRGEALCA